MPSPVCFISGLNLHLTTVCSMGKSCQHLAVLLLYVLRSVSNRERASERERERKGEGRGLIKTRFPCVIKRLRAL